MIEPLEEGLRKILAYAFYYRRFFYLYGYILKHIHMQRNTQPQDTWLIRTLY